MSTDCLTVMKKDLDEVVHNRYIISSMATLPLIFSVIIPLLYFTTIPENVSPSDVAALGQAVRGFAELSPKQALISFLVQSNLPFYLLMPGIMPTLIAAYSIAGEKKNGTLEPMLATPLRASDILIGKSLAAILPAVLITWASFGVYALLVNGFTSDTFSSPILPDLLWMIALFVTGPLLAVLSVYVSVLVSARLSDVRAAQQISAVLVVPIMGLFVLQLFGMVTLSVDMLLAVSAGLLVIDLILIKVGSSVFQREEILTRWG